MCHFDIRCRHWKAISWPTMCIYVSRCRQRSAIGWPMLRHCNIGFASAGRRFATAQKERGIVYCWCSSLRKAGQQTLRLVPVDIFLLLPTPHGHSHFLLSIFQMTTVRRFVLCMTSLRCPSEEEEMLLCCWRFFPAVSGARWRQAPTACCRTRADRRPLGGSDADMAGDCRALFAGGEEVAAAAAGVRLISAGRRAPGTWGRRCGRGRWGSSRRCSDRPA